MSGEGQFSRNAMGQPLEKLTNGTSITVRFTANGFDTLDKIARRRGMERSEFIRHLVEIEIERERAEFLSLHAVFAHEVDGATNTKDDGV